MWLGMDLGTSSAKVAVVDPGGRVLAEAVAPYGVNAPQPGWAESDPDHWWQAFCACLMRIPPAIRAGIQGIGFSGQMHGLVLCDSKGQALRPALLWMDQRARPLLARYPASAGRSTGNPLSAGMAGPMLLWLGQHEPETLRTARWALQPKDWLRLRLGGEALADPSDASATLLGTPDGQWDLALIETLGLDHRQLPEVRPAHAWAGALSAQAAAALGLPAGVPMAVGCGDTPAAAFGSGLHRSGDSQLTTGSGAQLIMMHDQAPAFDPRLNAYCAVQAGNLPPWYAMAAMQNCGIALEWVRRLLGLSWSEAYERAFAPQAMGSTALFIPHLTGERSPWMDAGLRGSWQGLASSDDAGTLMRAAFLGVAFSIRAGWMALRSHPGGSGPLRLAGGGSLHPAWRALLAEVLQQPLALVDCPNASARGAALLGALAAGTSLDAILALAPQIRDTVVPPSADRHAEAYARYETQVLSTLRAEDGAGPS